jgi:hypothetical protein
MVANLIGTLHWICLIWFVQMIVKDMYPYNTLKEFLFLLWWLWSVFILMYMCLLRAAPEFCILRMRHFRCILDVDFHWSWITSKCKWVWLCFSNSSSRWRSRVNMNVGKLGTYIHLMCVHCIVQLIVIEFARCCPCTVTVVNLLMMLAWSQAQHADLIFHVSMSIVEKKKRY